MGFTAAINRTSGQGGYCKQFTREAIGSHKHPGGIPAAGAAYDTARETWDRAKLKVTGDHTPPPAVPVFFAPNHVAPSLGGGLVRTTNAATNRITNMNVDALARNWGNPYLGYTLDMNGELLTPPVTATLRLGAEGDQVLFAQADLKWIGFYGGKLDGSWGPIMQAGVVALVRKHPELGPSPVIGPKIRAFLNAVV